MIMNGYEWLWMVMNGYHWLIGTSEKGDCGIFLWPVWNMMEYKGVLMEYELNKVGAPLLANFVHNSDN